VTGRAWLRLHESGRVSVLDPGNVTVECNDDEVDIVQRW
jgi:hypothetical protein